MSKLIILRGPSGAGKSTVAKVLHQSNPGKSVLIEQDYYKEVMVRPKEQSGELRRKLILTNALVALDADYDVVLDGIFHLRVYSEFFEELFTKHPSENYAFFFDVSFDETVRRHDTRPQKDLFDSSRMKQWYADATPLGHESEHVIPESNTLEQTLEFIRQTTGLL